MKKILLLCGVLGLASVAQAELKVPGSVFKMEELGKAKAKAAATQKPLVFVVTDPEST
ncbi:MAG: hypothetical protein AAF514_03880 [Verrucomicrobiota bacterium]